MPPKAVAAPYKNRRLLTRRTRLLPPSTYSSAIPFPLSSERSPYLRRMVAPGDGPVNGGIPLQSFAGGYLPYAAQIHFRLAVVGKEAVDLLFYVGELGVAETLEGTATQQGSYQGFVAL